MDMRFDSLVILDLYHRGFVIFKFFPWFFLPITHHELYTKLGKLTSSRIRSKMRKLGVSLDSRLPDLHATPSHHVVKSLEIRLGAHITRIQLVSDQVVIFSLLQVADEVEHCTKIHMGRRILEQNRN